VSLATLLRENAELPVAQAVEIADQVAAALEEAHRHGIVHRDVKPGNVFVDPRGRVKVGDFGIARTADSELTQAGVSLGTPGYLAPEVVRGAPADARADVFALGALTYTLLSGRKPFPGVTPQALTASVLENDPEAPHAVRPEVPPAASNAVLRALAKSPAERTPSVEAFRHELTSAVAPTIAGGVPTERVATAIPAAAVEPTMTVARPAPAPRRRFTLPILIGAAAVLLAALLLALRGGSGGANDAVGPATPAAAPATPRPRPVATPARAAEPPAPRPAVVIEPRDGGRADGARGAGDGKPGRGHGRGRGHGKGKKKD
jgi:serine/threonine-protein kinase